MCKPTPANAVAGPQRLAKMFKLPGDGSPSPEAYSFQIHDQSFVHPTWTVEATVKGPKKAHAKGWIVTGSLKIDSESGRGSPVELTEVSSDQFSVPATIEGNEFSAEVVGHGEATIEVTGRVKDLNRKVAERSRLRVDLRARRNG